MQIRPFQAAYPDMRRISSADHFFSTIKEKFGEYWQEGFYHQLPGEGVFVCTVDRPANTHTGLVVCVDIREYLEGNIRRHEKTLPKKEIGRLDQLRDWAAQVKPVTLTYRPVKEIDQLLQQCKAGREPLLEVYFAEKNETHRFWNIHDQAIMDRLQRLFARHVPTAYISDGHHRTASNATMFERLGKNDPVNPFQWLPCVLFSTDEVDIYDFNRIVEGLGDFTPSSFLEKLTDYFEVSELDEPRKPRQKHELTLFLSEKCYSLKWYPHIVQIAGNQIVALDVDLLNDHVLNGLLGIADVRNTDRLKYFQQLKNIPNLTTKTLAGEERFAFCMYPVTIEDFLKISDTDGSLPPKSTWFEPRVRSGLLVRRFEL
ncbi:MAG: DUF1015 family protein [Bacteroidota bacterium]